MNEIWKRFTRIGAFGPDYVEVSSLGRVRGRNGALRHLADNGAGYMSFGVGGNISAQYREYIHRAVAMLFIPNPDGLPQVNHKDCNKANNCVENLEWIQRSENILHAHAAGRMVKRTTEAAINILTKGQVVELYTAVKRDNVGVSEQARQMNIPRTTASSILNKRSRRDITDPLDVEFANGTT